MRRKATSLLLGCLWLAALASPALADPAVGTKAPAIQPEQWFNNKGPLTWSDLQGRLILIEKWATW